MTGGYPPSGPRVLEAGIRIRITGYSFRKALETEKKICWNHFYIRGKRQHMFFVLIIRFRQFGAEKICQKVVIVPFTPRIRQKKRI